MEERKIYGLKVIYTPKVMIIEDSHKIKNPEPVARNKKQRNRQDQ